MKTPIFILALLLFSFTAFPQVNKLLRQATKTTNLEEKIELYSQVIEIEPKNLDAYFYRALAKNDSNDFSGAIVDYSRVIVAQPDPDTYYNRANSRYSLKDYLGAQQDYESAYKLDPNFMDALYSLGCVKFDLGDFEGAIKDFTLLLSKGPLESKIYFLRAAAYSALEEHALALNDYSLAVLADPSADSYYNRAVFLLGVNYYERARVDFSVALKLNQNNAYAYFYRGTSSLFLGKYNEAIVDFNNALHFDTLDFDALLGLALTYHKLNDLQNSKLYLEKAKAILSPEINSDSIDQFKNTYWFENQFLFFNENYKRMSQY